MNNNMLTLQFSNERSAEASVRQLEEAGYRAKVKFMFTGPRKLDADGNWQREGKWTVEYTNRYVDLKKTTERHGRPKGGVSVAEHGTLKRHRQGCRCEPCVIAASIQRHEESGNACPCGKPIGKKAKHCVECSLAIRKSTGMMKFSEKGRPPRSDNEKTA